MQKGCPSIQPTHFCFFSASTFQWIVSFCTSSSFRLPWYFPFFCLFSWFHCFMPFLSLLCSPVICSETTNAISIVSYIHSALWLFIKTLFMNLEKKKRRKKISQCLILYNSLLFFWMCGSLITLRKWCVNRLHICVTCCLQWIDFVTKESKFSL